MKFMAEAARYPPRSLSLRAAEGHPTHAGENRMSMHANVQPILFSGAMVQALIDGRKIQRNLGLYEPQTQEKGGEQ